MPYLLFWINRRKKVRHVPKRGLENVTVLIGDKKEILKPEFATSIVAFISVISYCQRHPWDWNIMFIMCCLWSVIVISRWKSLCRLRALVFNFFFLMPINTVQRSPGIYQVGATPFSPDIIESVLKCFNRFY